MPLDEEAHRVIEPFLAPGERLLWSGRPRRGVVFHLASLRDLLSGLILLGFGAFFEWIAVRRGDDVSAAVFGVWSMLYGLRFALAPFVLEPWRRAQTFYGVSDDRAFIVSHWFGTKMDSFPLKTLEALRFTQRMDGTGTIRLGKIHWKVIFDPLSRYWLRSVWGRTREFEDIPDVRNVYRIIVKAEPDLAILGES